jgi:hypothetical protein
MPVQRPGTSSGRDPLILDPIERLFTAVLAGAAVISWVGLTLAGFGWFSQSSVICAALLPASGIGVAIWHALGDRTARGRPVEWVIAIALAVAAAWLFFPAGEYVFEGSDASVYIATGRRIAATGGATFRDPLLDRIPEDAWPRLFRRDTMWPPLLDRFPGGMQIAAGRNLIQPNFFHLLPVWMAVADVTLGFRAAFLVPGLFVLLGSCAAWLLGRRALSTVAATVGVILLLANFGQIWLARTQVSESLMQALFLGGLFLLVLVIDGAPPAVGAAAGAMLGLTMATRIDGFVPVVLVLVAVAALYRGPWRTGSWKWTAAMFVLAALHAMAYALLVPTAYTLRLLGGGRSGVARLGWWTDAMVLVLLALLVAFALCLLVRPALRRTVVLSIGLASVSVMFGIGWLRGPEWAAHYRTLVSAWAIPLVLLGAILAARAPAAKHGRLLVLVLALISAVSAATSISQQVPWAFRRYAVVLPLSFLLVGHATAAAWSAAGRLRWLVPAVPAALVAVYLAGSVPTVRARPMQGALDLVQTLADRVPGDALWIVDRGIPPHVGLALGYSLGRDVLVMARDIEVASALPAAIGERLAAGGRAVVVTRGRHASVAGLSRAHLGPFDLQLAGTLPFAYTTFRPASRGIPETALVADESLEIYDVLRAGSTAVTLPHRIEIGPGDFAHVLGGFYAAESMPGVQARWTSREARVQLPRVTASADREIVFAVRFAAYRPPGAPLPAVEVSLGDVRIARITEIKPGFGEYRQALPEQAVRRLLNGDTTLTFTSDTFVPKLVGTGEDTRTLGVAVDWILLEAGRPGKGDRR